MIESAITGQIIESALKVHKVLGPGLLESSYEECLYFELKEKGLFVEKQKPLPLVYKDVKLEVGYRVDLMIENKIIVEVKSVEAINDVHLAQILTYLKLTECPVGLLINFNVNLMKKGLRRVLNKFRQNEKNGLDQSPPKPPCLLT